jgi:WD40 repeat protein
VSCGADRQIFYWDVASGRVIRKFRGHNSEVTDQSSIDGFFVCDYNGLFIPL